MGDDHVIAGFNDVGDIGRCLFNYFQLGLGGGWFPRFLERIPAQGDHDSFHKTVLSAMQDLFYSLFPL